MPHCYGRRMAVVIGSAQHKLNVEKLVSMRQLFHLWLSPGSRAVRLALAEKDLDFELIVEPTWQRRPDFLALNPACDVPVMIEEDGSVLCGTTEMTE